MGHTKKINELIIAGRTFSGKEVFATDEAHR